MIKRITIENFKGIGSKVELDIRPVTLLFGPNSSGKSTILHAIHYVHSILETGNPNVGKTLLGGDLNLGGFKRTVHDHDLQASITIGFDLEIDIDDYANSELDHYEKHERFAELSKMVEDSEAEDLDEGNETSRFARVSEVPSGNWSLGVEISTKWSHRLGRAIVEKFKVRWWGQDFAEVGTSADGARTWITNVNLAHYMNWDKASVFVGDEILETQLTCLAARQSALPRAGFHIDDFDLVGGADIAKKIEAGLSNASDILKDVLARFLYVGPIRSSLPHEYKPPANPSQSRWAKGLGAWDALCRKAHLVDETNHWLNSEERLNTGYKIKMHRFRELDEDTFALMQRRAFDYSLDETFLGLANSLKTREQLVVRDTKKNLDLLPSDLGEGIGQVVPVIVASLVNVAENAADRAGPPSMIAIEQPELHIHPRMQTVLGDLFLSQCEDKQFLIETHSEHLMLRLLRRIRETTDNDLGPNDPSATVDSISVYYIDQIEGEVKVRELRISEDGEFLDRWPDGFFGERMRELI